MINALLVLAYALQKNLLGMEVTWCNIFNAAMVVYIKVSLSFRSNVWEINIG